MYKNGKSNALMAVLVIGIVALVLLVGYAVMGPQQTIVGPSGGDEETPSGATTIVTTATTLTFAASDALQKGTAVSSTNLVGVNGGVITTAPSSVSQGDVLDIIMNASGYHSQVVKDLKVPSATTFTVGSDQGAKLFGNATITQRMFNTNKAVVSNGGGATNLSALSAGTSATYPFEMDGQDLKSTNAMRCILESTAGTNTSKVTLDGFKGVTFVGTSKPSSYSLIGATSNVWVYDIDAIEGAGTRYGSVTIVPNTAKAISAGERLKVTCLPKENFYDSNTGELSFAIEDSLGNAKSIASYSFSGYFQ